MPWCHPSRERGQAIDVVRGLAMAVMVLDHAREFWSPTPVRAEDVAHTSVLLFLTRWVTYFCALTFVFLSGASIFLPQPRPPGRAAVSRFLLTRGLLAALAVGIVAGHTCCRPSSPLRRARARAAYPNI